MASLLSLALLLTQLFTAPLLQTPSILAKTTEETPTNEIKSEYLKYKKEGYIKFEDYDALYSVKEQHRIVYNQESAPEDSAHSNSIVYESLSECLAQDSIEAIIFPVKVEETYSGVGKENVYGYNWSYKFTKLAKGEFNLKTEGGTEHYRLSLKSKFDERIGEVDLENDRYAWAIAGNLEGFLIRESSNNKIDSMHVNLVPVYYGVIYLDGYSRRIRAASPTYIYGEIYGKENGIYTPLQMDLIMTEHCLEITSDFPKSFDAIITPLGVNGLELYKKYKGHWSVPQGTSLEILERYKIER